MWRHPRRHWTQTCSHARLQEHIKRLEDAVAQLEARLRASDTAMPYPSLILCSSSGTLFDLDARAYRVPRGARLVLGRGKHSKATDCKFVQVVKTGKGGVWGEDVSKSEG